MRTIAPLAWPIGLWPGSISRTSATARRLPTHEQCLRAAATPFDRTAGTMASATGLLLQGRFDEGLAQLLALKTWALENGWVYSASGVDFAAGPALAATGRIGRRHSYAEFRNCGV